MTTQTDTPPEDDVEALITASEVETDQLGEAEGVELPAEGSQAEAPPSTPLVAETPMEVPPVTPIPTEAQQQRITHLERQNQQYQEAVQQSQIDRAERETAQDFMDKGISEDQANLFAREVRGMVDQMNQQAQYTQAQVSQTQQLYNAAIYYAKQNNLSLDDLTTLGALPDVASMKRAAENMKRIRGLEQQVSEMRQETVPIQSFDNNSPAPQAAGSYESHLDRYTNGATDERAIAAGKRAATGQ